MFNIFNALGSICFAYNFTGVLMEIQVSQVGTSADLRAQRMLFAPTVRPAMCFEYNLYSTAQHTRHMVLRGTGAPATAVSHGCCW